MSQGDGPTNHSHVYGWSKVCQIEVTPWEADTITRLSHSYLQARSDYKEENAAPPFMTDEGRARLQRIHAEKRLAMFKNAREERERLKKGL